MSAFLLYGRLRTLGALAFVLVLAVLWVRPTGESGIARHAAGGEPGGELVVPPGPEHPGRAVDGSALRPSPPSGSEAARLDREAMNAWMTGDIRAAITLFEQAIAAAPDDPVPHSHYGRLLTLMVSYQRAIPLLERARDLAPHDAQTWLDLATVYERAQRIDDAWAARAEAEKLVGAHAVTRDEQGRFVVVGNAL